MDITYPMTSYQRFKIEEVKRCSVDPIYFIENYISVYDPCYGKMNIKLRDYQKDMIDLYLNNDFSVTKMPRQYGKTVCSIGFILWYALFSDNKNILLVSTSYNSTGLLNVLKTMYEDLVDFMKVANITQNNKELIEFDNGTQVIQCHASRNMGRGQTLSLVYLDEFAFVDNDIAYQVFASLIPSIVTTNGKIIINSTENFNITGHVYDEIVRKARNNDSVFKLYEVDY